MGDVSVNPGLSKCNPRLGTISAHSMYDKAPALFELVASKGIDLLGITDPWLTPRVTSADLAEMTPTPRFCFFQLPRAMKRGEGDSWPVCFHFFYCSLIQSNQLPTQVNFESTSSKIECSQLCHNILNIYHSSGPASTFFKEFQDILSYMASLPQDLLLMGDFNLHIDSSSSGARYLTCILEFFDLNQYGIMQISPPSSWPRLWSYDFLQRVWCYVPFIIA